MIQPDDDPRLFCEDYCEQCDGPCTLQDDDESFMEDDEDPDWD